MSSDISLELVETIKQAAQQERPVYITGGNTKEFYGRPPLGTPVSTTGHSGIVSYEPTELVITARSGTRLHEIEAVLAEQHQMLAFEPPAFGEQATLGGTVACGLSGPRRWQAGPLRDFVLGVRMINGNAEDLSFGGQVMKNVAGYDVSRLLAGSLGTLGLLLEVSLKVLPAPRSERTLVFEVDSGEAARLCLQWSKNSWPISATCYHDGRLLVRLSGSEKGVSGAANKLGGEESPDGPLFWEDLKEHKHSFFAPDRTLWRVSVPPNTPPLAIEGDSLVEWGGALRWLKSDVDTETVRGRAQAAGGHAVCFRGPDRSDVFHPLTPSMLALHQKVKRSFDPKAIFNPGRMYEGI